MILTRIGLGVGKIRNFNTFVEVDVYIESLVSLVPETLLVSKDWVAIGEIRNFDTFVEVDVYVLHVSNTCQIAPWQN